MKWLKHHADAHEDAKLRKVMIRYGAEGYALYWYCLELIAGKVSAEDLTFELEHDAELIAHVLRIDPARVEEILAVMVELGLFEESDGRITCLKIARHLDERFARGEALKAIIREAKRRTLTHDSLKRILQASEDTGQTSARPSEDAGKTISGNRAEQSRAKRSRTENSHRFAEFWSAYPRRVARNGAEKAWARLAPDDALVDRILADLGRRDWANADPKFIPHPTTYLNNRRWEDEPAATASVRAPVDTLLAGVINLRGAAS